jgi:hypothetical protein
VMRSNGKTSHGVFGWLIVSRSARTARQHTSTESALAAEGTLAAVDLLLPALAKIVRAAHAGLAPSIPATSTLSVAWSDKARSGVERWLHGGDCAHLADVVRQHPLVFAHPAVFKQLAYLHRLAGTLDAGDYEAAGFTPPENAPPAGTRTGAHGLLRAMAEALVQGLLGHGWSLKRPPMRRGRKAATPAHWKEQLLSEYEEVIGLLRKETVRPSDGPTQSSVSKETWIRALGATIQRVWEAADVSKEIRTELVPGSPPNVECLSPFEALQYTRTVFVQLPLSSDKVRRWAEEAAELAAEGPVRDRLAYELLAHRWGLTRNQVRRRIEDARRLRGAHSRPRRPRQS